MLRSKTHAPCSLLLVSRSPLASTRAQRGRSLAPRPLRARGLHGRAGVIVQEKARHYQPLSMTVCTINAYRVRPTQATVACSSGPLCGGHTAASQTRWW